MISKVWKTLLLVYLILLPFQTRWIYSSVFVNGVFWEYGSESVYALEIILWAIVIIFLWDLFSNRNTGHLFGKIHYLSHKQNLVYAFSFCLFLVSSILFSTNKVLSFNTIFLLLEGLCISLVILVSNIERKKLIIAFWIGGVLQSVIGILQFFSQEVIANKWFGMAYQSPSKLGSFVVESGQERWLRAYGSFGSPNIFGGYLALVLVLGLLVYLKSKPVEKIYLTVGQVVVLFALVLSFSRSAWIAAAAGVFIIGGVVLKNLVFEEQKNFLTPFAYLKQLIFYVLVLLAAVNLFTPLFVVRIEAASRLEAKSINERTSQYKEAVKMFKDNWIFGTGPGTYTYNLILQNPTMPAYEYQPVHNIFLLMLVEWGSAGFVVWSSIFLIILKKSYKVAAEFFPVLIVVLLLGLFDHYLLSSYSGMALLWVVFGLVL